MPQEAMMAVAVAKQKILNNVCDRVDPPRVSKREMVFLDWDQVMRLADAHSGRFQALIYLAVNSGMRWGELVGLRRFNLDVRRLKVRVTEQLVQLKLGEFVRREPKPQLASARSPSLRSPPRSLRSMSTVSPIPARTAWCSRTQPAIHSPRRAS